jgi:hypothetical protein
MYELNQNPEDMSKRIPVEGLRFGRLYVAEHEGKGKYGCAMYRVICECGTEKVVRGSDLRGGKIISCGCAKREQCTELGKRKR